MEPGPPHASSISSDARFALALLGAMLSALVTFGVAVAGFLLGLWVLVFVLAPLLVFAVWAVLYGLTIRHGWRARQPWFWLVSGFGILPGLAVTTILLTYLWQSAS